MKLPSMKQTSFSRINGRLEMTRTETRRSGEDNEVCFMDGSFIGVQPHKFFAVLHIDLVWVLALEIIQGTLQTILESIGHGDEFYISFLGGKVLIRGTTSTTTAADQCELELITPGDLGAEFDGKTGGGNRGGGGGARLEESPASWIDGG